MEFSFLSRRVLLLAVGLLLASCGGDDSQDQELSESANAIRVAAFNVQVFGQSKSDKPEVMANLVKIVRRYDAVIIQEIRDAAGTAIQELLDEVNAAGDTQYQLAVSPRAGRSQSKEQYALIYNDAIKLKQQFSYNEADFAADADRFEREPHSFHLEAAGFDFGLIVLHAKPDDAVAEIDALDDVYQDFIAKTNDNDALILGDLNADCSYASNAALESTRLCGANYGWLTPDDADTTVKSTDCAYDRIVAAGLMVNFVSNPSVYYFDADLVLSADQAEAVSDHYPVEVEVDLNAANSKTVSCTLEGS